MASSLQETLSHQPTALPVSPENNKKEKKARKRAKKDQPPSEAVTTESKPDAESERPPRKPRARKSKGGENQLDPVPKSNASAPESKVEGEVEAKDKKKRRKRESRAGTEAETKECSKENDRVDEAAVVDNEKDVGKVQDQEKPEENGADKVEEREKISDEASKESKKRKRQTEQAHVESQTTVAETAPAAITAEENEESKGKKPKREKRPKIKSVKGAVDTPEQPEVNVQVAPEGSEGTTIFTDSSLSDQAKKNIFYAHLFTLSQSPSPAPNTPSWKFSKAKQNWLMRNIFSDIEVPETYFEVVLGYLKTTHGHSRNTLIEQAKKILEPPQVPPTESVDPAAEETADVAMPDTASPKKETKLENSTQNQSDNVDPDVPMIEASESNSEQLEKEKKVKQVKKTRARQLLEAMGVAQ
ncbi:nucleolar protein [Cryptococcus neoformans C23]|uniref:Nucleolar protein n=1 Tax=Cryptococcus neoformans (strain H99 / ATCC 208821 / CBS 10515 / FGSC 9487) TaxID=235443 RepID=J9VK39_CRYN9|nr:nucleolar protein [Cryptococcus neoformans var. grubii H99]AUB24550.1 nucleolar protein [Cryptococcus neoformans var. grubii]OWZ32286.1 nucleolar protein [Cryptococcus neoformans var. grubii AD2-60a]OWZ44133.1 nucleolar protein [Cryptococcus neoformans var. grubii C23]OXC84967.1 nucleolar protein [Cryptococcus neoformans var. grubii AD1-7a]OXG33666.1 nucleolar protein [Cryptococcus neoformans var. grubii Bt15]OXG42819.1 nucleolar protein [Cryptococcus neoformans var. grubii Bt120]OXG82654|eukprot:XP_012049463.1 nucleolar protein [Cryptococcus neoformans var. grubii H99]